MNKIKFGIAVTAGAMLMATTQAAIQDTVTFTGIEPALTNVYTSGTNVQHTSPVSYTLGRIDFSGDTTEINGTTGDWVADNSMRVDYPGGSPVTGVSPISGTAGYSGTFTFAGSTFVNNGATVPVSGVWNFWFVNVVDDSPTGSTDNSINITFNFTDEQPVAPPSTAVTVDPLTTASNTVALTVTAGGIAWYKVNIVNPTDAVNYLDISTNGSGEDLDFGWYDSTGNWIWYIDGTTPTYEPGLSFGGAGNPRPLIGTFKPKGQHGDMTSGTYYLAVGYYSMSVDNGWTATTNDTTSSWTGEVRFDTGVSSPPSPPPTIDLTVDPNVTTSTTAALSITAGGVAWYKVTVVSPTTASQFLDIHTTASGVDLDFVWFDNAGAWQWYVDGQFPTYEPGLSFGGFGIPRPSQGTFTPYGQNDNIPAGTYYLAVAHFPMDFDDGWDATTSNFDDSFTGTLTLDTGLAVEAPVSPGLIDQIGPDDSFTVNNFGYASQEFEAAFTSFNVGILDGFKLSTPTTVSQFKAVLQLWNSATPDFNNITNYNVEFYNDPLTAAANLSGVISLDVPANPSYIDNTWAPANDEMALITLPISANLSAGDWWVAMIPQMDFNPNGQVGVVNSSWTGGTPLGTNMRQANPGGGFGFPGNLGFQPFNAAYTLVGTGSGNTATGTVDFGQLTAAYNTGANLPTSIPVSFRDAGNSEIATGTASYNPVTGAFSAAVPGAVTVPYRVSFKLGFWLRKTMPNPADPAAPLGNYNFGTVTPLVGDSDDDNEVTNFDYSLWAAANGNSVTANTDNDFDGDGEITNFDYSLWAANNGALGDN